VILVCERCKRHLGETTRDIECIGSFKPSLFADVVLPGPKDAILCRACGYKNIFMDRDSVKLFQSGRKRVA